MDDFDRYTAGARLPGPEAAEGDIQDEPTAVRPRASAPDFMLGLPALTAPPSVQALSQVSVHVTPLPPAAQIVAVPSPRDLGLHPHLLPSRAPERTAERVRAVRAARVLLVLCAGLGFAVLGICVDRSGLLQQLGGAFGEAAAPRAASVTVGEMMPAIATRPLPTTESLSTQPSTPDVEAALERARELLSGDAPKAALLDTQAELLRALKLEPNNAHVHACLGQLYLRMRTLGPAFTAANEAVRLRPKRPRYRILLGDVLRALGRKDDAEEAYARAAELDPQGRVIDGPDAQVLRATNAL